MSKIVCHEHCPGEGGTVLAGLAAVILAGFLAGFLAVVVESVFLAIVVVASVLGAAGIALFVFLLARDRQRAAIPAAAPANRAALTSKTIEAISAPRRAIEAPKVGVSPPDTLSAYPPWILCAWTEYPARFMDETPIAPIRCNG